MMKRDLVRICLPLLLTLAACAHAANEPASPEPPLGVGRYSFDGSVPVEDRFADRTDRSTEFFSGILSIGEDGSVALSSSHGSCQGGRIQRGFAIIRCRGINARIGARSGTVGVTVQEEQEVRSSRCAVSAPSNVGGTARNCIRFHTETELVIRTKTTAVTVTRIS